MSILTPRPQPATSTLLADFLSQPLQFGEPVTQSSFAPSTGLREVLPGPPSPPADLLRLDPPRSRSLVNGGSAARSARGVGQNGAGGLNGYGEEDEAGPSTPRKRAKQRAEDSPYRTNGSISATAQPTPSGPTRLLQSSPVTEPLIDGQTPERLTTSQKGKEKLHVTPSAVGSPIASSLKTQSSPAKLVNGSSSSYSTSSQLHAPYELEELAWPASHARVKRAAAGLVNPSMACYANATLQVMMHTPPLVAQIQGHDEDTCPFTRRQRFCMQCELKRMLEVHWEKTRYKTGVLVNLSQIRKGFSKNKQEDSHEFFRFACDALQNGALFGQAKDLPEKIKHTSWVHRLWGGRVRSRVICQNCRKPSDTFDHFLDLSLDCSPRRPSVPLMLQGFVKEDKLEGDNRYHCENCKAKANATKSFRIAEAPPVLTLHLKRFSMQYNSYGRSRASKFNEHITFTEDLDIGPYMVDRNTPRPSTRYRLFGVTCHRGSELRFGHYTAYVKGPGGTWFHADDEDVRPCSLQNVLRDKTAYLLSYIRIDDESPNGTLQPQVKRSPLSHQQQGVPTSVGQTSPEKGAMANGALKRQRSDLESEYDEDQENRPPPKTFDTPFTGRTSLINGHTPHASRPTLFANGFESARKSASSTAAVRRNSSASSVADHGHSTLDDMDDNVNAMSAFGGSLHSPVGRFAPRSNKKTIGGKVVSTASFYGHNSPRGKSFRHSPYPPSKREEWRQGKKHKHGKKKHHHGAPMPFVTGGGGGRGEGGGRGGGGGGFGGKARGTIQRMKDKPS